MPGTDLVLTTFDLEERVYKALCAGASGFLIAPSLTRELLGTFAHRLHSPVPDQDHDDSGRLHHLTGREREVLARVAYEAGLVRPVLHL
ncbi:hypothetical protein [Streptomyces acidiscabies]|uniref:hypothetical protein n=1 Tax=Streptomyces acidiscabies TaxID=42234 RepID=UPI0038F818B1